MVAPIKQMTNGSYFRSRSEQIILLAWGRNDGIQTGSARRFSYKLTEIIIGFWGFLQLAIDSGVNIAYKLNEMMFNGDTYPVLGYFAGTNLKSQNF